MVKFWESDHVFDHSWEYVTSANWRKYPNPFNPAVASIDILDRKMSEDNKLHTKRLMTTEFKLPNWVQRMIGEQRVHVVEHSIVDVQNKTLEMRAKNVTACGFITIEEFITYTAHPEDPTKTVMKQRAEITVPKMSFMEKTVADTIFRNSTKGKQAMEWAINIIKDEAHELKASL